MSKQLKVFVYLDKGVDLFSFHEAVLLLKTELCPHKYLVDAIDSKTISNESWMNECALLVIPGGRDLPYLFSLGSIGCKRIRDFVYSGGAYLGICAGAYFASGFVEFQKGGEYEVLGDRLLRFFPGSAVGPALSSELFDYQSHTSAMASTLLFEGEKLRTYYHGGSYFKDAAKYPSVETIATYDDMENKESAVICLKLGAGRAVLSGVHFEVQPNSLLKLSGSLSRIGLDLLDSEFQRKKLSCEILNRLGLF